MATETTVALTHKDFLRVDKDHKKAASAAHLRYVRDCQPGISRIRKGKGFSYLLNNSVVRDPELLERIRRLVIPPAWTQVWICADERGHIQATGLDVRRRKQYRYHPLWNSLRNETKFHRLYEFGKALPLLRSRVEEDLRSKELTQDKVLATVVSLMERTYIRVGNYEYEKANGSYGLTTLKNKHVSVSGDKILFSFKGKKGIQHEITLRDRRLSRIVAQCQEIPGKELFEYYGEDGVRHSVDSGMVNTYIREAAQQDFSAKDFRTWAGSLHALKEFVRIGEAETATESKKNINLVLDGVSAKLGNTRAVCRKYYVHPGLVQMYEEGKLFKHSADAAGTAEDRGDRGELSADEQQLMKILKNG